VSTPELLTTDHTTLATQARRAELHAHARVLAGSALAAGGLWWVTTDLYGAWVFWTVLCLGAVASAALSGLLGLAAVLHTQWTAEGYRHE
jgi:apolipoprotein N-acyltransferase